MSFPFPFPFGSSSGQDKGWWDVMTGSNGQEAPWEDAQYGQGDGPYGQGDAQYGQGDGPRARSQGTYGGQDVYGGPYESQYPQGYSQGYAPSGQPVKPTTSAQPAKEKGATSYLKSAIILGIGVTLAAFSVKAGVNASKRYARLTPKDIARLNGIKLVNPQASSQEKYYDKLFAQYPGGFNDRMTQTEALLILGINQQQVLNLTPQVLKSRHRKMMILNHPDRGGSPYLAMKVNTARDLLDKTFTFKN